MSLRNLTKQFQPAAEAATAFNPADFVQIIDNPFFSLQPGTTFFFENEDGSAGNEFVVTRQTKQILGVTCIVVRDTAFEDGEVVEKTADYFAQDKDGNVWYFGEDTKELVDGEVVSTEGTWRAGVDGALPGIIMKASPQVGDEYAQETAPGVAEDRAEVLSLTEMVNVPYANVDQVLQTFDFTPLDPTALEHKFYGPGGVGLLQTTNLLTGEGEFLVKIQIDGTSRADTLRGKVGTDELNGKDGNDDLNGMAGADTIHGGAGRDTLDGGADDDADILCGDKGKDEIRIDTADQAWGGDGDDWLVLVDNVGFGKVDGGEQAGDNLARNRGDILQFDGELDLTMPGLSERIAGVETLSMKDGEGNDVLTLDVQDVLSLGDGEFEPRLRGGDDFDEGSALRIDGDTGDQVNLDGGTWIQIATRNAPHDYNVFSCTSPTGSAYVLVQEAVSVSVELA